MNSQVAMRWRVGSPGRFCDATDNSNAPMPIAPIPSARMLCGGLMIRTSRPYASCHQLSNGADVTMAKQPHTATQAPSGARNPQKVTAESRAAAPRPNVVRSATYPDVSPAINPPAWMTRCAGVQNVSRPIDMCHEMSQYTPIITHSAANTTVGACQAKGTGAALSAMLRVAYFGVVRRTGGAVVIRRASSARQAARDLPA